MRTRVALPLLLAASLLSLAWWFLAPSALGGRAVYVVTHGVSMQPRFHTGDLAIVYPAPTYRTGDVAAYHSDLLHTTVLHRIVAATPDGYLFKGDNNSWVDPERPTEEKMVGRLQIRIPHGGVVLGWLHDPIVIGVATAAILLSGATGLRRRRRRRARARTATRAERAPMNFRNVNVPPRRRALHLGALGGIGLSFAVLALAGYTVPGDSTHSREVHWTTQVAYTYSADTARNLVYPDGQVQPGQTVFRNLVNRLTLHTTWSVHIPVRHQVRGSARLQAVVRGPAGWTHPVDLGRSNDFSGDRVVLTGTLDLPALDAAVNRAADLTGVPADQYTITVRPQVTLTGTVSGVRIPRTSAEEPPDLTLAVSSRTVAPMAGSSSPAAANTPGTATATPGPTSTPSSSLNPEPTTHTIAVNEQGSPTWALFGHDVPVAAARWAGLSGVALALIALIALLVWRPRHQDRCLDQARRYRSSIISVSGHRVAATSNVLEVTSLKALAQVARRYDRLILHQDTTPGVYLVEDETGLYRFECPHRRRDPDQRRH